MTVCDTSAKTGRNLLENNLKLKIGNVYKKFTEKTEKVCIWRWTVCVFLMSSVKTHTKMFTLMSLYMPTWSFKAIVQNFQHTGLFLSAPKCQALETLQVNREKLN